MAMTSDQYVAFLKKEDLDAVIEDMEKAIRRGVERGVDKTTLEPLQGILMGLKEAKVRQEEPHTADELHMYIETRTQQLLKHGYKPLSALARAYGEAMVAFQLPTGI